jgi:phosphoglucosamine mutase
MKLFGTDGIRGKAGQAPLEPETVARVGGALAKTMIANDPSHRQRYVIGRDTRESGTWIEEQLARGLTAAGGSVVSAGVVPTPAIAYLARTEGFDAGIVISASHNPYEDNGIKVFGGAGTKLTEQLESSVEASVADQSWSVPQQAPGIRLREDASTSAPGATADKSARQAGAQELCSHYVTHLLEIMKSAGALAGSKIVVDCANGATTPIAPALFKQLGFDVETIGVSPNGRNINLECGSTHLDGLAKAVVAKRARLGVAFDGDGDRALFVDHDGTIVDGDAVLLMSAIYLKDRGRLPGPAVVATVMSNIGLEIALRDRGITLIRTAVGDKYVMEEMVKSGYVLGGEQSGHVIFSDHLFTGDGLATALNVLRIMADTGRELSDLAGQLVTYPQVLVNVRVKQRTDLSTVPAIASAMKKVEQGLAGHGRLLVRYSGTEPLLRIMLEGKDDGEIKQWANHIADVVRENLA